MEAVFPLDGLARRVLAGSIRPGVATEMAFSQQLGRSLIATLDAAIEAKQEALAAMENARQTDDLERQRQTTIHARQAQMAASLRNAVYLNDLFEAHALQTVVGGVVAASDECAQNGISLMERLGSAAKEVAEQLGMPSWYHQPAVPAAEVATEATKRQRSDIGAEASLPHEPGSKRIALPQLEQSAVSNMATWATGDASVTDQADADEGRESEEIAASVAADGSKAAPGGAEGSLFGGGFQGDFASDDDDDDDD